VITALDLILLKFLVFWNTFRGLLAPRIDAWIQDGVFQLQRRAYEAHGEGTWERLEKEVPATLDGTELATFPLDSTPVCKCSAKPSSASQHSANTTPDPQVQTQINSPQMQPIFVATQTGPDGISSRPPSMSTISRISVISVATTSEHHETISPPAPVIADPQLDRHATPILAVSSNGRIYDIDV
jgi:hypothetical protein